MKSYRKELWFEIKHRRELLNITPQIEECLRECRKRARGNVIFNSGFAHGLQGFHCNREPRLPPHAGGPTNASWLALTNLYAHLGTCVERTQPEHLEFLGIHLGGSRVEQDYWRKRARNV